ncbi:MAG: zinc-dependent metalloprotease [Planctomycetaceae bacterium]|nr:zinc-dependent metalloprotease [Planctomycetaceae bacterium]
MASPRIVTSCCLVALFLVAVARADEPTTDTKSPPTPISSSPPAARPAPKSPYQALTEGTKSGDVKPEPGMWSVHYKEQQLLVEITPAHLNKDYLVITSIAKGISSGMVVGGMSWRFGDELVWSFRKVGDKLHVIRRNPRFRAKAGSPEADAIKIAYSDSVLYALPILTKTDSGGDLVDFTRVFLSDDEQVGRAIGPGFFFAADRSTFGTIKSFPMNVEVDVAAVYSGMGRNLDTVADTRGVQVQIHYSISPLVSNGYKPRIADDRVGFFNTVVKDFSDTTDDEHFVRYINRWHVEKMDSSVSLSPPKKPIVFYIENTVPVGYRPIVQSGIEEWNKAFEKLGIANAIEVRQDPGDIDPEDRRYNFFRWIQADAGFAMGPSRVNPFTGEILDADIIFDAGFLDFWKSQNENFGTPTPDPMKAIFNLTAAATGRTASGDKDHQPIPPSLISPHLHTGEGLLPGSHCQICQQMHAQFGLAATVLADRGEIAARGKLPEELVRQGLKEVVMHEVGHTLGLRHNFKASTWKTLAEIEDPARTAEATAASVMDYLPVNIAPAGVKQSNYLTPTIGPYDYWAIEYGYSSVSGDEAAGLAKIAARGSEPGLDFGTDEDLFIQNDPRTNLFDLGKSPEEYARRRIALVQDLLPKVVDRSVADGEGYQRARVAFGLLFREYWHNVAIAAPMVAGIYANRDHKADPNARPPLQIVEAAKQRDGMKLIIDQGFKVPVISPQVLNSLASSTWFHWGTNPSFRGDYPIHAAVLQQQSMFISYLLSPSTLNRLQDSEVKVEAETDAYTAAEHLKTVVEAAFSEFQTEAAGEYTLRKPLIDSFRRNLQRYTLRELSYLVTLPFNATDDARTLARMHLTQLDQQITALLGRAEVKLDDYSRAHLIDCQERIRKVLQAEVTVPYVN